MAQPDPILDRMEELLSRFCDDVEQTLEEIQCDVLALSLRLKVMESNELARTANFCARRKDDPVTPIHSVQTYEIVRGLPATVGGIVTLTGQECDAILRELGLPEGGTVGEKQKNICLKLGLTILLTH